MVQVVSNSNRTGHQLGNKSGHFGRRKFVWLFPTFILIWSLCFKPSTTQDDDAIAIARDQQYQKEVREAAEAAHKYRQSIGVPECIPPSIDEFPRDFFTQEQRLGGAIIVHFFLTAYFSAMLAVVCDNFFVPSLENISEQFKVPTDIAGATFMAIGTSSPELFSSVIGAFVTEGDIGVGTIVGSAVFNILGVTSMTGIALWKSSIPIDSFPITRDMMVYALSVCSLVLVIRDNIVTKWEAFTLLMMFVIYITLMYFNRNVQDYFESQMGNMRSRKKSRGRSRSRSVKLVKIPENDVKGLAGGMKDHHHDTPLMASDLNSLMSLTSNDLYNVENDSLVRHRNLTKDLSANSCEQSNGHVPYVPQTSEDDDSSSESSDEEEFSLKHPPSGSGFFGFLLWALMWPPRFLFYLTIPDCRKVESKRYFLMTFTMCVCWIALLSYLCAWMVTIIGHTLHLPDTVAGLTILAAGISVPEVISSVIVVRNGHGNMAICNLIGSNVFDILFCLSVPWLIKTVLFSPNGTLVINSSALTYTTVTLLSTVLILFVTFYLTGWKLNRKVGFICLGLYAVFLILACLYETNYFGPFNPPPCPR